METNHLIGLDLIIAGLFIGVLFACFSARGRDAAFMLIILGAVYIDRMSVHFVSREWYRGTSRGFEFSLVDIVAVSLLAGLLLVRRSAQSLRLFWPASLALMLVFFLWSCVSVMISEPKLFGAYELFAWVRGMVVFLAVVWFVRSERELKLFVLALGTIVCLQGLLAIKERYLGGYDRVTGSLHDPNSLSTYLCMTGPVFLAAVTTVNLPMHLKALCAAALTLATIGVVLTVSRTGVAVFALLLAGTTVMCVSPRPTLKKAAIGVLVILGLTGLIYKSWDSLHERYTSATLEEESEEGRGVYLKTALIIVEDKFLGVGLNNWSYAVSKTYGVETGHRYENYDNTDFSRFAIDPENYEPGSYAEPAHNLAALTAGELGVPGLAIFGLLWLRWFQMGAGFVLRWRRPTDLANRLGIGIFFGLCGIFLQSVTEWTFRQTPIFFTFNVLVGVLASLYYQKRQQRKAERVRSIAAEQPAVAAYPYEPLAARRS